ncbi:YkvA family protein [Sandaracinobacteroides saxicola]|uniref:DUF1232 domain-containing protein n=1 Tax=Sandaracinobacteroides saxicola TaxID=2759707 RepID=A0A7G5IJM2_9SPHN|nr:YkvA family protein [Sandaracinobacteroides saxicola]QMW23564.1 DUF1232 domain-containing protein [Sandaracinobacteroides saxicola]
MSIRERVRAAGHRLRRDAHALWIAARDPRTPLMAKLVGGFVAAYAFSPIDLIPDFVPVLGWLDDLIIVPFGIWLAMRLVPAPLWAEHLAAAEVATARPISTAGAVIVGFLWLLIIASVAGSIWAMRYW